MRCWWCGIEPANLVDTTSLGSAFATRTVGRWPTTAPDHNHAEQPPTPAQLEQAGHEALSRIHREATS